MSSNSTPVMVFSQTYWDEQAAPPNCQIFTQSSAGPLWPLTYKNPSISLRKTKPTHLQGLKKHSSAEIQVHQPLEYPLTGE